MSKPSDPTLNWLLGIIAILFGTAAALLLIASGSAATATGGSPDLAIQMVNGRNTGVLGPGQQRWFQVTVPSQGRPFADLTLDLFFTPGHGFYQEQVNFQLYRRSDVVAWQTGQIAHLPNFGAGALISGSGEAGERLWRGPLLAGETYFVAIRNDSPTPVDYWLFDHEAAGPDPIAQAADPPSDQIEPGAAPATALPLSLLSQPMSGRLEAGGEKWYRVTPANSAASHFEAVGLSLSFTPANGNLIHQINFEIFTPGGVQNWSPENKNGVTNIGAGSLVTPGDPLLVGQRVWRGWLVENEPYYLRVQNGSASPIDYRLMAGQTQ